MKILKKIGLGLLALIVLLVIISFFLPSKTHLERSIVINAPADSIFAQVNTMQNWPNWSPWAKIDPAMKTTYFGPASGEGAGYSWDSKKVGKGTLTVTKSVTNELLETKMDFGDRGFANAFFKLSPAEGGTKVVWGFDSETGMNPIAKYFGLLMDKFLGPDYEKGLANIKAVVEKK